MSLSLNSRFENGERRNWRDGTSGSDLTSFRGTVSSIETLGWMQESLRLVRKVHLGGEQARILARLDRLAGRVQGSYSAADVCAASLLAWCASNGAVVCNASSLKRCKDFSALVKQTAVSCVSLLISPECSMARLVSQRFSLASCKYAKQ